MISSKAHDASHFREDIVSKAVRFIECLVLTKSTKSGRPERWKLLPCHRELIAELLGWVRNEDETRQYRRCYFSVARKNAKTQLAAALALYLLISERDQPEVYLAAKDRDQASICYKAACDMVRASGLTRTFEIVEYQKVIKCRRNGGTLKALSSEGASKHGLNPSAVIIDELHAWGPPEQELYDALTTGSVARRQPLILIITTAGISEHSICGEEYKYACQVRDGVADDSAYLPLIYELPKDADWTDEALWHLANPTLGDIVTIQALREARDRALKTPTEQVKFRRLHCNQWVNSESPWVSLEMWDACEWDGKTIAA
jgi:phage terminase large subunit-like protein